MPGTARRAHALPILAAALILWAGSAHARQFLTIGSVPLGNPGVPAFADFNGDGTLDLAVTVPVSNAVAVFTGTGGGAFSAAVTYPVGTQPVRLTTGDFNGDGTTDLAVADENFSFPLPPGYVSVLINQGGGLFAPEVPYAVGSRPMAVVAVDLTGDGTLDLVTADDFGGSVSVLRGTGAGTFDPPLVTSSLWHPVDVAPADLNGDGTLDLAVAAEGGVRILLGDGTGLFSSGPTLEASYPMQVAVADLDHDGRKDVAAALDGTGSVAIWAGDGAGGFAAATLLAVGKFPVGVVARDLNRDAVPDLVVTRIFNGGSGENVTDLLFGRGDGTFGAPRHLTTPQTGSIQLSAIAIGDVDSDGWLDLAITSGWEGLVRIQRNVPATDLEVSLSALPNPVGLYRPTTVTARVRNLEDPASGVSFTLSIPVPASITSATSTVGTCAPASGGIACDVGALPAGGLATITIVLEPSASGTYGLWAQATSADGDVDPSNDHASVDLLVDPCYQQVLPATMAFPAGGGPGSIQVVSPEGCAWSTALHASWISITPPASGQGPGSVAFTVAPNPSGQPRTGTIGVGPAVFTVEQAAAAPALRLLSPNGGEELAAGEDLVITWEEPSTVRSIAIDFSYDGGNTWKRYVAGVLTPAYPMTVPAPPGNRTKCLVRLTAYDEHGGRLATDRSDAVFSIVVVRVQAPNGGESLRGGQQAPVQWALHGTLRPVAQTILSYTRDGGATWKKLATLGPGATSWDWTIPALPRAFSRCRVKVALRDVQGKSVGSDVSDGWFLIDVP